MVERHVRAIHNVLKEYGELSVAGTVVEGYGFERFKLQIGWVGLLVEFYKIYTTEAVAIYFNTGLHLQYHGIYEFARDLLSFTVKILTHLGGPDHPELAEPLNRLAMCYYYLDQPNEAEPIYNHAIEIAVKTSGGSQARVGIYYDNLVGVYVSQKRYAEAAEAAAKASAIIAEHLGSEHNDTAISLSNQAALLLQAGNERQAEETWLEAMRILEANNGSNDYQLALPMQNLAMFYTHRNQEEQAEALLLRTSTILEAKFGNTSARLIQVFNDIGSLYIKQRREEEGLPYLVRVIDIMRESKGGNPSNFARALNNLGVLYDRLKRHTEAQPILEEALVLRESVFGEEHPETATGCKNLGVNYFFQRRYSEAEVLYLRALVIREKTFGVDSPFVEMVLQDYINLLYELNRPQEAEEMVQRSNQIRLQIT